MVGQVLSSYDIVSFLGEGGMGAVYLGQHQRLARRAAIKVLHPQWAHSSDAVERFFTEARATSLIRHPGIVDVLDCAVENGMAFIVMEYLEGLSLARYLERFGPFQGDTLQTALRIAADLASAIGAAHAHNIVHRDLKPDNMFLSGGPDAVTTVKVLDFGIAKLPSQERVHHTSTGALMGTPQYMSPEQCKGAGSVELDFRTDIYSLGCVLYEMLCGATPFTKPSMGELIVAHLHEVPPPIATRAPHVPAVLAELVTRMLAKAPDHRPADMAAVERSLRQLLDPAVAARPLRVPGVAPRAFTVVEKVGEPGAAGGTKLLAPAVDQAGVSRGPSGRVPVATTLREGAGSLVPPQLSPRPRRLGRALVVGASVAVAAIVVFGGTRLRAPRPATSTGVVNAGAPAAALPGLAGARTPPDGELVVIRAEPMPAGTVAVVDGKAETLPLRLAKGSSARAVRFESPGFEPVTVTVDGAQDRSLALAWKRTSVTAEPAAAPPGGRAAPPPSRRSAQRRFAGAAPATAESPATAAPQENPLDMRLK